MLKSNTMEFELTPEILDEIVFAMEDQSGVFLFDAGENRCRAADGSEEGDGESRYYPVPDWDSVSGFRLMERFVSRLRNPVAREELRDALAAGHGVFRSFKNILHGYPELERKWYQMKDGEMRRIVYEWYNTLRDSWGMERVGPEPEETAEIVESDFSFRAFGPEDASGVDELLAALYREIRDSLPGELSEAIMEIDSLVRGPRLGTETVFVAESADGDLAGIAVSRSLPSGSLLSAQLSVIGVYAEFRGLGVAKELVLRTVSHWAGKGCRWLVFASPLVPPSFMTSLARLGFSDRGHVSVLDLTAETSH